MQQNSPNVKIDPLTPEQRRDWDRDGFVNVRGLLKPEEVKEIRDHFDALAERGETVQGHYHPDPESDNPLRRRPRVLQAHAFSDLARRYMLHDRIGAVLREILQDDPLATQCMYYFKPTGAKGQALHQDNYYLRVKPFTCVAAWCAIDPATPENGGMSLVPGTRDYDIQCPKIAEDELPEAVKEGSGTRDYVPPPPGTEAVPCVMAPGDVLFFNGSVIHGSLANTHPTLWRRSFICHYMPAQAREIAGWYHTHGLWSFDGARVDRAESAGGGACGDFDTGMTRKFEINR